MSLHAHSMAADVPARFDARVHSVFRHAVNLQLPDGSLVPVVAGRHAPVGGIGVSAEPGLDLSRLCAIGEGASLRAAVIRLGRGLSIALHGAARPHFAPPPFSWQAPVAQREQAWRESWSLFHFQPPHLASEAMSRRLAGMVTAVHRGGAELAQAARGLVGLGPGLTPSGDDALVGWLCAFAALGQHSTRIESLRVALADGIRAEVGRTTAISKHYLLHAAQGETGMHLNALMRAISEGDSDRARQATEEALAVGATSGADGVLGLLTALASAHAKPAALLPLDWARAFTTAA